MAKKINRKLNGVDTIEKEFGDFLESGGEVGGSITVNGGANLKGFAATRTIESKNYKSVFGTIAIRGDGMPSAQIKLENSTDSTSSGVGISESELFPTVAGALSIGNSSYPFANVYLSSGSLVTSAGTIKLKGNDQKQVYICASDTRNNEGSQQCDLVLIKKDDNAGFSFRPTANGRNYTDIGASTHKFANAHFSGDINIDGFSKSTNGYTKLPNGLILQWGVVNTSSSVTVEYTFPTTFPNACLFTQTSLQGGNAYSNLGTTGGYRSTSKGYALQCTGATRDINWIAIGY